MRPLSAQHVCVLADRGNPTRYYLLALSPTLSFSPRAPLSRARQAAARRASSSPRSCTTCCTRRSASTSPGCTASRASASTTSPPASSARSTRASSSESSLLRSVPWYGGVFAERRAGVKVCDEEVRSGGDPAVDAAPCRACRAGESLAPRGSFACADRWWW